MFSKKWTKVPCTLRFTIHTVDLKKPTDSEFQLSWSRGDSKGSTDKVVHDENNKLQFNSEFECKCTMYISQSEGVRPKNVKLTLTRFLKRKDSKVYGKLTFDVGKYYGKNEVTRELIEMETGRSTAPVLDMSLILYVKGSEANLANGEENDMSFIGEARTKVAIDQWDMTEGESDIDRLTKDDVSETSEESSKKKGHKKKSKKKSHKHKNSDLSADTQDQKEEKDENEAAKPNEENNTEAQISTEKGDEQSNPEVVNEEKLEEGEDKPESKKDKKKKDKKKEKKKKHKKDKSNKDEEPSPKEDVAEQGEAPDTQGLEPVEEPPKTEIPNESDPTEVIKPEIIETPIEQEPKTEETQIEHLTHEEDEENDMEFIDYLSSVIMEDWSKPDTLFLIIKLFVDFGFFSKLPFSEYQSSMTIIEHSFSSSKQNVNARFVVGYSLCSFAVSHPEYEEKRVKCFTNMIEVHMTQFQKQILAPHIRQSVLLMNRFSTAKFEDISLLEDFNEIFGNVSSQLNFPDPIKRHLSEEFKKQFDRFALIKVIDNPNRFTFTNAIIWNTFLTTLDSDAHLTFKLLREGISALIMAPNIAKSPTLADEICSDLSKVLVAYILMNYIPDDVLNQPINPLLFIMNNNIEGISTPQIEELPTTFTYKDTANKLHVNEEYKFSENSMKKYPFLHTH